MSLKWNLDLALTEHEPLKFFDPDEMDDILTSPEKFHSTLEKASMAGYERAIAEVKQHVPALVQHLIGHQLSVRDRFEGFYNNNPALRQVRPYVDKVMQQIGQQNPNMSFDEVASQAAEIASKELGIGQSFKPRVVQSTPAEKPTLPGRGSSRRPSGNASPEANEFADVMNLHRQNAFTY